MDAQMENKNAVNQPQKLKKSVDVRWFVGSPWLLITIPLLLGGFYLINHPEYVITAMKYPYALACVLAIVPVFFVVRLIISFFSVIEKWIRLQFERAKQAKRGHFFEIVTVVFMFVSVCEAGPFFNDIQHNVLYGALGYITVLAFDLIAVVCIDARRKELARGGTKAGIYLTGVFFCAIVSMVANLYSALSNFHGPTDPSFPGLLKAIAPYIGIMFPVMIVFLAFSRDTEVEVDDAETYRKQQQKRVNYLVARREMLAQITREMEQIGLIQQREFILKALFFTQKKTAYIIEIVTSHVVDLMNGKVNALRAEIERKEQVIASQAQLIESQVHTVQALHSSMQEMLTHITNTQYEHRPVDIQAVMTQVSGQINDRFNHVEDRLLQRFTGQINERLSHVEDRLSQDITTQVTGVVTPQIEAVKSDINLRFTVLQDTVLSSSKTPTKSRITDELTGEKVAQLDTNKLKTYGLTSEQLQTIVDHYPNTVRWLSTGASSASQEEIVSVTNHTGKMISLRVKDGTFKKTNNPKLFRLDSVLKWLLNAPLPTTKESSKSDVSSEKDGPNTGEMEAINQEETHHNSNGNGHHKDDLNIFDLPVLARE